MKIGLFTGFSAAPILLALPTHLSSALLPPLLLPSLCQAWLAPEGPNEAQYDGVSVLLAARALFSPDAREANAAASLLCGRVTGGSMQAGRW